MAEAWDLATVDLVVSAACNLRCAYCYQVVKRPGQLPWPAAKAAVALLLKSRSRVRRLVLTGGEPLLAISLVRRIIRHVRAAGPAGRAVSLDLLTNGTLLDDGMAAFFARNRVGLQISMDGVMEAQCLRGAWTFARLDALLDQLRTRQPRWFRQRVSVAVTLVPASISHLAESVEYLLAKGVREIAVSPAIGPSRGWRQARLAELDDQFSRVFRGSLAHYERTGRVPLTIFRKAVDFPASPSQPLCAIANGSKVVVNADGHVYGCPPAIPAMLSRPGALLRRVSAAMHLGTVTDPDLASRLPAYRRALAESGLFGPRGDLTSSAGPCRSCRYLGHCVVCPLSIAHAPGARDPKRVPGFICAFSRISLKYRDRFPSQVFAAPPPRAGRHLEKPRSSAARPVRQPSAGRGANRRGRETERRTTP